MSSFFETLPKPSELIDFLRFVAQRFQRDRCTQIAGSLTYTTLLSIVPLFTVIVALLSAFPVFEDFTTQVKIWLLLNLVPEVAGKIITVYMTQFTVNAAKLSAVGIMFLIVTALAMLMTIDRAFNSIWRVQRPRPWLTSMLVYWALITLGPFAIALSLSVKVYLETLTQGMMVTLPFGEWIALNMVPFAIEVLVFFLFFRIVPNRFVPNLHAFIGALVAASAFDGMKHLLALYVQSVPTYSIVYGAFASVPILLMWLFCAWLVILLGAEVTAGLSQWRGSVRNWVPSMDAVGSTLKPGRKTFPITDIQEVQFRHGLVLMKVLVQAQSDGRTVSLAELRKAVLVPFDTLEDLVDTLLNAGLVERSTQGAYFLVRQPEQITLADLYQLFVLRGANIGGEAYAQVSPVVAKAADERHTTLQMNLAQAFELNEFNTAAGKNREAKADEFQAADR